MDDELKRIARRIRSWRDDAGLTLQELGYRSGVSASTVHKIENLQTVPTINVLLKVLGGLERRPSELFDEDEMRGQVAVLSSSEQRHRFADEHIQLEPLAAPIPHNRIGAWRIEIDSVKGMEADIPLWQCHGEVIMIVERGSVKIDTGRDIHLLGVGDSIHLGERQPNGWHADGDTGVVVVLLSLLPRFKREYAGTQVPMSRRTDTEFTANRLDRDEAGSSAGPIAHHA